MNSMRCLTMIVFAFALLPQQESVAKKQHEKSSPKPADQNRASPEISARYEIRKEHDPDGIGKFYMGREIAQVMGHLGADWLERPEREDEEQPKKLMTLLKFKQGESVADIGAGTGYFTFRIADKVGASGKVLAVDIQPEMLSLIEQKRKQKKLNNIELVQGIEDNPKLQKNSVDSILLVDVYHEFSFPYEMTNHMVEALKPGGRLIFVEYRLEDDTVPIKTLHRMSEAQVKKEMSVHSLEYSETISKLPRQHIIIFKKTASKVADPSSESKEEKRNETKKN